MSDNTHLEAVPGTRHFSGHPWIPRRISRWCAESSTATRELRELALAHASTDRVEAASIRSGLFEQLSALMQAWANYVSRDGLNMTSTTQPLHEVRIGVAKAAISQNETDNDARLNVTFSRICLDSEGNWKTTSSLDLDHLPVVAKASCQPHTSIFQLQ